MNRRIIPLVIVAGVLCASSTAEAQATRFLGLAMAGAGAAMMLVDP